MALYNLFLALEEAWKIQALYVHFSRESSVEVPYLSEEWWRKWIIIEFLIVQKSLQLSMT